MSDELVFNMGEFAASFPSDLRYAKNHMWAREVHDGCFQFGLSAYAVRLLQDVYFLDLVIEPEMQVAPRQEIGSIESKKAESSLYCPVAGRISAVNEDLLDDPSAINTDKYGRGWMFELQSECGAELLDPPQYIEHLEAAWKVAQRTIKGQANA